MDFSTELLIFTLSGFIGYFIVWGITPSLHAPLMSVSNAISGIIILGAIEVLNDSTDACINTIGFIAVVIASINIFGGFAISQKMLQMFKPKETPKDKQQ